MEHRFKEFDQSEWMDNLELLSTCEMFARRYEIDPKLIKAIITQESSWNCYAIRYEQTYSYLYKEEEFAKKCKVSLSTEINTQKMSWGLCQLMGALARELGHEGALPELIDPAINIELACKHLSHLKKMVTCEDDIISAYNGGLGALHRIEGKYRNQGYVDSVKKHYDSYLQRL